MFHVEQVLWFVEVEGGAEAEMDHLPKADFELLLILLLVLELLVALTC